MLHIYLGLGYELNDAVVDGTDTVREAFTKAGLPHLLQTKYTVNLAKNGGDSRRITNFDVTLDSLSVADEDSFIVNENLKSAR